MESRTREAQNAPGPGAKRSGPGGCGEECSTRSPGAIGLGAAAVGRSSGEEDGPRHGGDTWRCFVRYRTGNLKPGADLVIGRLATFMNANPQTKVLIEGHTDSRGSDEYNDALSERRARAVANALTGRGVSEASLRTQGRGKAYPVASNDTTRRPSAESSRGNHLQRCGRPVCPRAQRRAAVCCL